MGRPELRLMMQYYTSAYVAKELGLSKDQLAYRIKLGILPQPTEVVKGTRYYSPDWLKKAQRALRGVLEGGE